MTAPKTAADIAALVGGQVIRGAPSTPITRVRPTDSAGPGAITFVTKSKYVEALGKTDAAAVLLSPRLVQEHADEVPDSTVIISVEQPYVAFAQVAQLFAPPVPGPRPGVHPSAVVAANAEVDPQACIGPLVHVGARARIGPEAVLHTGAHVAEGASVGAKTVLFDNVVIRHECRVGARCILHAGVVVGSDGFGFANRAGEVGPEHLKIPQVGDVVIEDDVEIGANCTIDRGTMGSTRIGRGTKIDNLVQIAHNVEVGPGSILVAQSGIAGSSRLGRGVILAAQVGIAGHVHIGDGSIVSGQSGVKDDLPPGSDVMGSPAVPKGEHVRSFVRLRKLDSLFSRVKKLERLIKGNEDA